MLTVRPLRVVLTGGEAGVDMSAVLGDSGCGWPGSGVDAGDTEEVGSSVSAGLKVQ